MRDNDEVTTRQIINLLYLCFYKGNFYKRTKKIISKKRGKKYLNELEKLIRHDKSMLVNFREWLKSFSDYQGYKVESFSDSLAKKIADRYYL